MGCHPNPLARQSVVSLAANSMFVGQLEPLMHDIQLKVRSLVQAIMSAEDLPRPFCFYGYYLNEIHIHNTWVTRAAVSGVKFEIHHGHSFLTDIF